MTCLHPVVLVCPKNNDGKVPLSADRYFGNLNEKYAQVKDWEQQMFDQGTSACRKQPSAAE